MQQSNGMSSKERLLAAMRGKETDRMPWAPFLAYWWEAQPEAFQEKGATSFLKSIGADPLLRGGAQLYKINFTGVTVTEKINGKIKQTTFSTPVGELVQEHTYVSRGNTWFLTRHPVQTSQDMKTLQWMNEKLTISPDMDQYNKDKLALGDAGLIVPIIGTNMKTSFQSLIEHWVGTEELTYMIEDEPEIVEECLAVMQNRSMESVRISVESEAEAFIFWEDSSTTNVSPKWFKQYVSPEISEWANIIHKNDQLLIHHACGHLRDLLPLMAENNVDVIESISPPPTGNIELWDARNLLPEGVRLIGGIEPTAFLNLSMVELEVYVKHLMDKMGKRNWVLANSDSCPPGVSIEKFEKVTEIVRAMA